MMRYLALVVLGIAAGARASAVQVEVFAAPPSAPAIPVTSQAQLLIGTAQLTVDAAGTNLLSQTGNWVQGLLNPVWKTNAQGQTVDGNGFVTTDPTKFVLLKYQVIWMGVSLRDSAGNLTNVALASNASPQTDQTQDFIPDTTSVAAQFYWYDGTGNVDIVDIKNGTPFDTPGDVQRFQRQDFLVDAVGIYRSSQNRFDGPADFDLVHTPTRVVALSTLTGGTFGVVTNQQVGYVFRGASCLVNSQPNADPYLLEGTSLVRAGASALPNGTIAWPVTPWATGATLLYDAPVGAAQPDQALPEPYLDQFHQLEAANPQQVTVITQPANRTTVEGQDVQQLVDTTAVALNPNDNPDAQSNLNGVATNMQSGEYLTIDSNNNLVATPQATYQDPSLEAARQSIAAGMQNQLSVGVQSQLLPPDQLAPLTQPPQAADTIAITDAISQVEAQLYPQTATSLPLRQWPSHYHAETQAAGWPSSYLDGNPVPGDGTNPVNPQPPGVSTGAPAYDLNGDGSLDRIYTSDPYSNGMDTLELKWNVDAGLFDLGHYQPNMWKNNFAVYALSSAQPSAHKLLFCGYDGIIYVEKQRRWYDHILLNSFALFTHLSPDGNPNEYNFNLKPIGTAQADFTPIPPPVPTTNTVSWVVTTPVTDANGNTIQVITETDTETVYLYAGLDTPADLATQTFSDPTFVPRATNGRPTECAKYVRTTTPYTVTGTTSTPAAPSTAVVYFPAQFTDADLTAPEDPPVLPPSADCFMWDYQVLGDQLPWNYYRGNRFPRGLRAVVLNDPRVIAEYGSDLPVQQVSQIVAAGGVHLTVTERVGQPASSSAADIADWIAHRAEYHDPYDQRTDMLAGGDPIAHNWHGDRYFTIDSGAGFYIYQGQVQYFSSVAEQTALLHKMWDWDLYQPPTNYTILHVDNDPAKPLLNTVTLPVALQGNANLDPTTGVMATDIKDTGANDTTNAFRRQELINHDWFIFSAQKGREFEVQQALSTPKNTRLYCVEWDDLPATEKQFAGYDIHFINSLEEEHKLKGEIITKIYGATNLQGRIDPGSDLTHTLVTGDSADATLALAMPGTYIFLEQDMLYDKPAHQVALTALLNDGQYGAPQANQWVTNYQIQFRHPMAIFYDDRYAALVAAYGFNADPAKWTATWGSYAPPTTGTGTDACKVFFQQWANDTTLADLYNRMNAQAYQQALQGNISLPIAPTQVLQPIQPVPPSPWTGGPLIPPTVVNPPGPPPTPPTPPWAGLPGYDGLSIPAAEVQYLGQPPATIPVLSWWEDGHAAVDALGGGYPYLMNIETPAYGNELDGWPHHFTASFTWQGQDATLSGTDYFDDYGSLSINTDVIDTRNWTNGPGSIAYTFHNGVTYTIHLLFYGFGWPNQSTIAFDNPPYDDYLARQQAIDAFNAAESTYQAQLATWQTQVAAYQQYLSALNTYNLLVQQYDAWLAAYQVAYAQYEQQLAIYDQLEQVYQAYLAAYAAWQQQCIVDQALIAAYNAYLSTQASWVFLVEQRLQQPDQNWSSSEPTGQAYAFFLTQPDLSGLCPSCHP